MKQQIILLALSIIMLSCISSCKEEGCTDKDATNYCEDCGKSDNSCEFTGEVVFWNTKTNAQDLIDAGVTSLTLYVDGQVSGSQAASVYYVSAPACGQNGSMTVSKSLGSVKNKTYSYEIKDQDGDVWYEGTANYTANTCLKIQLQ